MLKEVVLSFILLGFINAQYPKWDDYSYREGGKFLTVKIVYLGDQPSVSIVK
jgi:hypothetical protein